MLLMESEVPSIGWDDARRLLLASAYAKSGMRAEAKVLRRFAGVDLGVAAAPNAQDMTCRTRNKNHVDEEARRKTTIRARVRAKVEHPFRILKRVVGFAKSCYRSLKMNHDWLCAAFALETITKGSVARCGSLVRRVR
jgi:IS5 family transposase